jgi:hypothetical protein
MVTSSAEARVFQFSGAVSPADILPAKVTARVQESNRPRSSVVPTLQNQPTADVTGSGWDLVKVATEI